MLTQFLIRRLIISGVTILISGEILYGQPDSLWTKTFGGSDDDGGFAVQQTSDGGYIVIGYTASYGAGFYDVWMIKTDAAGDTLWTKTFGGSDRDVGSSVQQTSDGGYIITADTESYGAGSSDVWMIKTDAAGDTLWTKIFGGSSYDEGYSVQQTLDGGYVVIGRTASDDIGAEGWDALLIKTDADGNTLWIKTYGVSNWDYGFSGQQTSDRGYIITGVTTSTLPGQDDFDVWLIKTDAAGDTLWTKSFRGRSHDMGWSVQQTSDGGYIIAGETGYLRVGNPSYVWLIKTDADGNMQWRKTFGGSDTEVGSSVQQTSDGGYIITGHTESYGAGSDDVWLIKTDAGGDTLWTKTFGGGDDDWGNSVQQTSDGGYIITGATYSYGFAGYQVSDVWLIKTARDPTIGIENEWVSNPFAYNLNQNYPNPFNPITTIEFSLPSSGLVTLSVYNILGREVETILNQHMDAGSQSVRWHANHVPNGIYFVRMVSGDFSQTRKMLFLR